ncbi:hypothetical protein JCM11251_006406 [Rhodosporidiobolus azoricus]
MSTHGAQSHPLQPVASTSNTPAGPSASGDIVEQQHQQEGMGGEGPRRRGAGGGRRRRTSDAPSYAQSEFVEIVRRQRVRSETNPLKVPRHLLAPSSRSNSHSPAPVASSSYPPPPSEPPSPHPSLSRRFSSDTTTAAPAADDEDPLPYVVSSDKAPPKNVENAWEFAGWGSCSYLELGEDEVERARERRRGEMRRDGEGSLGPWLASGVAGVAVAGSPLYAFPALVAVASVYSPISLLIATLLLSFWRPIMRELGAVLPLSGANYAYLLNSSSSLTLALLAASLTLLDDIATSVVAAATAASYIADEAVKGGQTWLTIVLLVAIALIGLLGVKGGATVTLTTLGIHLLTLSILLISAAIHWSRHGSSTLASNWSAGSLPTGASIAKAIYQGICIAFLGVTGFETAPDYIASLRPDPKVYPTVLGSLQLIAVCINAPLLLCAFAVLPMEEILGNESVLSTLGRRSAGRWLGLFVTVDAVLILCATVLAGLISAIALIQRLSLDGYLPRVLLRPLPITGSPPLVVALFTALCIIVYTSSGNNLSVVSNMFALVFLAVMALYPLSLLILSYNRPSLPHPSKRTHRPTPFLWTFFTLLLSLALIAGVIWNQTVSVGFFAAYMLAIAAAVLGWAKRGNWLRVVWWACETGLGWRRGAEVCVRGIKRAKVGKEVVLFVKGDEINTLFERILYVEQNEDTACIKLVHFYGAKSRPSSSAGNKKADGEADVDGEDVTPGGTDSSGVEAIPSELHANFQLLDEAFPSITIDLIFLQAPFSPPYIHALAHRLDIPVARCFMGCPSPDWAEEKEFGLRELAGVRVISD